MATQLFDDLGSESNEEEETIKPNREFAKIYAYNKKREDLHRLEELQKKGVVSDDDDQSSSDESYDEEEIMSSRHDLKFYDALLKIKNRDPSIINEKDKRLFEDSDNDNDDGNSDKKELKKEPKKKYLKDVNAMAVIEGEEEEVEKIKGKSYWDEQEEIRRAVVEAGEDGDDDSDGDLLIEKTRDDGEEEDEEDEVKKLRDEYHGQDEQLDENERFLKEYLGKKMWKAKDDGRKGFDDKMLLSEDEDEVEKADEFEAMYNQRFEEGGDRILGHSRFTEGSVRKKSSARAVQRKNKEERMAQAEFERKEELKRLKNLKKTEIEVKLEKIRAIAGIAGGGGFAIGENDLEEEFDPEEYDRKMKQAFDEDYYDEEDVDPGFGSDCDDLEKPDFDKEDELLGLPKDWDVVGSADGFANAREKVLKRKADKNDSEEKDGEDVEEDEEEDLQTESKRKKKRKISLREKLALDEVLEEYYKLDYEDTIGDIKTRFKYTSVPSQRYGLNKEELLLMDEKQLNQYVPLKKLAPYMEKEWKVPNSKRHEIKMKSKTLGKVVDLKDNKRDKKNKHRSDHASTSETSSVKEEKAQLDEPNGEATISRRAKRRHRQAELKMSQSRLLAYGIITKK